ncbi:hypothetical protein N9850_01530 [Granulosicoccus sp.]|nr:hypothetical protein [Granulosicoccus sp.]MDB4222422.1 hypothetical protein [Granulosicoccus sp.]
MLACYEVVPCGSGLYLPLIELGQHCQVVVLSMVPHKLGDRIKTDRCDTLKLSRMLTLYFLPSGKRKMPAQYRSAKYRGADRCDLHPRFDTQMGVAAIGRYDGEGRVVELVSP